MVCLGNICRSPMAQGVMEKIITDKKLHWTVDSCGTNGLHDGESPDRRAIREAWTRGIDISQQRSRRISSDDFIQSDIIFVMDDMNYFTVSKMAPPYQKEKIFLLSNFAYPKEAVIVLDPYYDNRFTECMDIIITSCNAIADKLM